MAIDYALVLGIINASEDPPAALRVFVDQEREVAAQAAPAPPPPPRPARPRRNPSVVSP